MSDENNGSALDQLGQVSGVDPYKVLQEAIKKGSGKDVSIEELKAGEENFMDRCEQNPELEDMS